VLRPQRFQLCRELRDDIADLSRVAMLRQQREYVADRRFG
jgi:hypothetical protein